MKHLKHEALHLAGTYLAIIMVMSLGFSVIFYGASIRELDRRPQHNMEELMVVSPNTAINQYLDKRLAESRVALLLDLVILNIATLLVGALVSYLLAERTLRPIEENMEMQAQFVGDASHELRTPLTALRTANEVALRQKKLSAAEARQVISENVDDIARLQDLTNSMLGLLREDPTQETWESIPVDQVVSEAVRLTALQAKAKNVSVSVAKMTSTVNANRHQVSQLLTILLDNAIKYSKDNGSVGISVVQRGKYVEFIVKDSGIGMSEETAAQVFTRFYRAEQSRTTPGYGLGLSIAKKIVDAHKGKLSVKSKLGKGSSFTVLLPASTEPERAN